MPTYSYRCTECSTAFDIQQAFTDDSLTECPTCQGNLRKLFSAVGVTFNGSGFYRTDSRAGGTTGSGKTDSGSADSGTSDSGSAATPKKTESTSSTSTPAAAPAAR